MSAVDHRTLPRRRGGALTSAIFEATLAELAATGYAALTMDAVAKRAQTSKATLYRRWPTRTELVMDAVYSVLSGEGSPPDTGSLRGDLFAMFEAVAGELSGAVGEALRGLRGEALMDPNAGERIRGYSRGAAQAGMGEIARRAVERGELDAGRVTARRLEAGPAILRNQLLFGDRTAGDVDVAEIVDDVVLPLLAAPRQPGAGAPLS